MSAKKKATSFTLVTNSSVKLLAISLLQIFLSAAHTKPPLRTPSAELFRIILLPCWTLLEVFVIALPQKLNGILILFLFYIKSKVRCFNIFLQLQSYCLLVKELNRQKFLKKKFANNFSFLLTGFCGKSKFYLSANIEPIIASQTFAFIFCAVKFALFGSVIALIKSFPSASGGVFVFKPVKTLVGLV